MGWLTAGDGYEIALVAGRVVARTAAGPAGAGAPGEGPAGVSEELPEALRDRPEVIELQRLAQWLEWHADECAERVRTWMVSSLPVPTALLGRVWPDEAWQAALRNLVVVSEGEGERGILRDVEEEGVLRVVDGGGRSLRIEAAAVTIPHPVLLPDLAALRDRAAELGAVQGVEQLHRAVWHRPADAEEAARAVHAFAGAEYRSWFALSGRATALGYKVAGRAATDRIREAGRVLTASVGIGDPYTEERAWTGALGWSEGRGRALAPAEVGPVAWSEGMRMAAALYAGGTPPPDGDADVR